jgi:hypothetical protein
MRKIREWSKCCKEKVMTNVRFERGIALFPSGHNLENSPLFRDDQQSGSNSSWRNSSAVVPIAADLAAFQARIQLFDVVSGHFVQR